MDTITELKRERDSFKKIIEDKDAKINSYSAKLNSYSAKLIQNIAKIENLEESIRHKDALIENCRKL